MLDLLLAPFAAAMIILFTHAYFGLHVIQREVIFVDLALAQIAALGGTVAFLLGAQPGTNMAYAFAFGFTLLGALIFSVTRLDDSPVPQEAIIGITYVVASAAVILLAGLKAEGAEHVKETLTGSLIWVDWATVGKVAASYGAIGLFHYLLRHKMLAITWAPDRVSSIRWWDFVFYATFGVAITSSVAIAGVLMVFSVLVIPAVVAFFYTQRFFTALLIAWFSGTVAIVLGIGSSFALDVATGPLLVVSFGFILLVALIFRGRWGVRVDADRRPGLRTTLFEDAPTGEPEAGS